MKNNRQVSILDYGMANLLNVARAFERCGAEVKLVDRANSVVSAERLVVPGVGAFEHALSEIRQHGHDDAIRRFVESGKPFFGICVGMQMLFDSSEEFGSHKGLGILPGKVNKIPNKTVIGKAQRVPHIGWNHLTLALARSTWRETLLGAFEAQMPAFYFVHSFAAQPEHESDRLADCIYGGHRICAAIQRDNIVATQFHPERSATAGLELIKEFLSW